MRPRCSRIRLIACVVGLVAGMASSVPVRAAEAGPYGLRPKDHEHHRELARSSTDAARERFRGRDDVLVLPGLVADRARRRVEVLVERSAVSPDAPCEFLVLAEDSDHTYETLLIAFAAPGDVQRALEFVGFRPGQSHDPAALRFWPRGESLRLSLARSNEPPVSIGSLLANRESGRPWGEGQLLFTGSRRLPARDPGSPAAWAVDVEQPKAIAALFSATDAVLVVPNRAPKSEVYQNTVPRWPAAFEGGGLLTLVLEASGIEILDLQLDVAAAPSPSRGSTNAAVAEADRLQDLRIQVRGAPPERASAEPLPKVLGQLAAFDRARHHVFATVRFEDGLDLAHARAMAGVLALLDTERGIRVEPPPPGHLHYLAFRPDPRLLDREGRIVNPPELVITENGGRITGRLIDWYSGPGTTERNAVLASKEVPVVDAEELRRALDAFEKESRARPGPPPPPVLVAFAPSTLGYGPLRRFLARALETHPTVHVFLDTPPGNSPRRSDDPGTGRQ